MLKRLRRGFTMIELVVVMSIIGLMLVMAAPSFANWLAGVRIRSTAEAMLAGIQYARSESVTRNSLVNFQLTSTLGSDCVISVTGTNWVVNQVPDATTPSIGGNCNVSPSDTVPPYILKTRNAADGGGETKVNSNQASLQFNGLGRIVPTPPATVQIDIQAPDPSDCRAALSGGGGGGGDITCLRILVSAAGQVRMCNPSLSSTDPQAC